MPDEIRMPVNAKIPKSLHDSMLVAVEEGKYKDKTTCITEALEKILNNKQQEQLINTKILQSKETEIQNLESKLQTKYAEIEKLLDILRKAPDPMEFAQLCTKSDELYAHNETLKKELEDIKNLYNNYMLQMQTLINQKAIEAPGAKKPWWRFW
jgi:Arc/MetJ-type ribon-helix-helix transcriptional regulator